MKRLFKELQTASPPVELRILSYGKRAAIMKALECTGMLHFFTADSPGDLIFGSDVAPLKDPDQYKALVVQTWMDEKGWKKNQVAYIDDDLANIDHESKETETEGEDCEFDQGMNQVLAPGHMFWHERLDPKAIYLFSKSFEWIRNICGIGPQSC